MLAAASAGGGRAKTAAPAAKAPVVTLPAGKGDRKKEAEDKAAQRARLAAAREALAVAARATRIAEQAARREEFEAARAARDADKAQQRVKEAEAAVEEARERGRRSPLRNATRLTPRRHATPPPSVRSAPGPNWPECRTGNRKRGGRRPDSGVGNANFTIRLSIWTQRSACPGCAGPSPDVLMTRSRPPVAEKL
jgi:hypothetical protein